MGKPLFAIQSGVSSVFRRVLSLSAALAIVGLAGCGNDNGLLSPATITNTIRSYSVYALSGTPAALPAAYSYTTETLERPQLLSNGATNFDLAFDLTSDGQVKLIPVRILIPLPPAGAPGVGIQKEAAAFDNIGRAPDRGYVIDSTFTASVGETVLLQLGGSGCVYGDAYYAKLVIDSIIVAERRMVVRSLVDRNCGYRSLTEGLPTN